MKDLKIIYLTLDLRRGMWVPEATGAKIVCSYKSDLLNWMREQGADIWCFEEEFPEAEIPQSTFLLLSRALTLNMLRELDEDFKFIVFKPSNKIKRWVEEQGWELVSSDVSVCRQLEDKIEFAELAQQFDVALPESYSEQWNELTVHKYQKKFGSVFIVQGRMGHAGSNTYFFKDGAVQGTEIVEGTRVKISDFINGRTYTVNAYIDQDGNISGGPIWQQVMHVPEWNSFEYGTVGVSAEQLRDDEKKSLTKALQSLSPLFQKLKYSGFLGVDLILDEAGKWYVIECNPRLTATVSLECLEDLIQNKKPLLKLHAERAPLQQHHFTFLAYDAQLSQLILRNALRRPWTPPKTLTSGIYAQNDKGRWQLKSRSYDARELQAGECLLLLSRSAGTKIAPGSDYASIQWKGSVYDADGNIDDRIMDFYERVVLGRFIREKDLWKDRYARLFAPEHPVFLQRKPVVLNQQQSASSKHVQVQLQADEVFCLCGETNSHYLVEKVDGTRGWLAKTVLVEEAREQDFIMPGKQSVNAQQFFRNWQNTPYIFGGNTAAGIDCSAFVQRYFWEVKGLLIPKYSQDQRVVSGEKIEQQDLQDDDLVFMHSKTKPYAHVGIFQGGKVWHSSLETGVIAQDLVEIEKRYRIEEFRRLVP